MCFLQIRTYDVVPISPSLGMVAFVPGTKPLKALLTDPALVPADAITAADNRYSTFILTKGGNLERAGNIARTMSCRAKVFTKVCRQPQMQACLVFPPFHHGNSQEACAIWLLYNDSNCMYVQMQNHAALTA